MPKRTARLTIGGVTGVAIVAAFSLSRIVSGLAEPAPQARSVMSAPPVAPTADTSGGPAPLAGSGPKESAASVAVTAENQLRIAFAGAVQSKWKLFSRPVAAELGNRVAGLRADFAVRVDHTGRLTDVRPVTLSGVATFDDNAAAALQNVDRVGIGSARSGTGWGFRVQFTGKNVRVRR